MIDSNEAQKRLISEIQIQEDLPKAIPTKKVKQALQTMVIKRSKDFDALFLGFKKIRAISYVTSPDLLLELFEKGYSHVEMIVGENLTEQYRQGLAQRNPELIEQLAKRIESGELRILVPKRTIHTKLYLLENERGLRIVMTSANFTETARNASRQINYAWYDDFHEETDFVKRVLKDYNTHVQECTQFMDDLIQLFKTHPEMRRAELIQAWLKGVTEDVAVEARLVMNKITADSIEQAVQQQTPVLTVHLPDNLAARKHIERILAPIDPKITGNSTILQSAGYLKYVQEQHGLPIMRIASDRNQLLLAINGSVSVRTTSLSTKEEVNQALEHIECYLDTVNSGRTADPQRVKTNMYEAVMYLFAAPFAHEMMKKRRARYGAIDSRGPRFLYIHGPSHNGKSTFVRFVLKLISGTAISPLPGNDFTKTKVINVNTFGSAFPLVFDDVVATKITGSNFEDILKSYWEVWWKEECVSPQIIITANTYNLKEWANSRIKRVDFDVHFAPSEESKERLNEIFSKDNKIFTWFAKLYLEQLKERSPSGDDELEFARQTMESLYSYAERPLPAYFPEKAIEKLYDPGRKMWLELLYTLKKARMQRNKEQVLVTFSSDMQHHEIKNYQRCIPQTIKHFNRGKTIIIETPEEFLNWIDDSSKKSWTRKIINKIIAAVQ